MINSSQTNSSTFYINTRKIKIQMNSKGAFKKCRDDNFAICSLEAEKGWVGVEPEYYSYGLFSICC